MPDASVSSTNLARVHAVDWGRVTPVVHLFSCFRVAMQPSKLVVSWVAVMGLWLAAWVVLALRGGGGVRPGCFGFSSETVASPLAALFSLSLLLCAQGGWACWLALGVLMAVATIAGLVVCRMAAARLCVGENIGPLAAGSFLLRKGPWALLSPVIPGVVVLGLGLALALVGLALFSFPWVDMLGGLLFGPLVLAGLAAAVVVAAVLLSYPLMAASVAVEGTDAFDTMSRCFAYLVAKPWAFVFYGLVSLLYGVVCVAFVWLLVEGGIRLAVGFLELGAIGQPSQLGEALAFANGSVPPEAAAVPTQASGWFVWFWLIAVRALPVAFAFSFACTASTMIYLLLRRGADGTSFDDCDLIAVREDPVGAAPLGEGTEAVTTPGSTPGGKSGSQPGSQPQPDAA